MRLHTFTVKKAEPQRRKDAKKNLKTHDSNLIAPLAFPTNPFYLGTSKQEAAKREGTAVEGGNPGKK